MDLVWCVCCRPVAMNKLANATLGTRSTTCSVGTMTEPATYPAYTVREHDTTQLTVRRQSSRLPPASALMGPGYGLRATNTFSHMRESDGATPRTNWSHTGASSWEREMCH